MYLAINLLGLVVFLAIGWVFSADRKNIDYKSVGCMLVLNLAITWLLTSFEAGRTAVKAAADGFAAVVKLSYKGINFALENWVGPDGIDPTPANFVVSALLPILLILPLFDILTYIGFLPWLIKWIGRGLSFVTRRPKFETFYALEMMFLGNADAIAASRVQLQRMKASRNVVISMMSMSCVSAAIIGSYVQMMPGEFVITAIPLNCINALTVSHMLFPVVISKEEDVIYSLYDEIDTSAFTAEELAAHEATVAQYQALPRWRQLFKHDPSKPAKEPFFSFLGDSIMNGGKVILIVTANVITFVALAGMIDSGLALIWDKLSLESILGVIMYVPSLLLGLNPTNAWDLSQLIGLKLVTNEFVAMGQVGDISAAPTHFRAVVTVFLTSFANFSTLGQIIGTFKSTVDEESNDAISKQVGRALLSGILVSLLSAAMVGLFIW